MESRESSESQIVGPSGNLSWAISASEEPPVVMSSGTVASEGDKVSILGDA